MRECYYGKAIRDALPVSEIKKCKKNERPGTRKLELPASEGGKKI